MRGFIEIAMFLAYLAVGLLGGVIGLTICAACGIVGMYMVSKSRPRGFFADAGFVFAWPFYLLFER
jgi:hypothetical protein